MTQNVEELRWELHREIETVVKTIIKNNFKFSNEITFYKLDNYLPINDMDNFSEETQNTLGGKLNSIIDWNDESTVINFDIFKEGFLPKFRIKKLLLSINNDGNDYVDFDGNHFHLDFDTKEIKIEELEIQKDLVTKEKVILALSSKI